MSPPDRRKENFASALRAELVRVLVQESGAGEAQAFRMASQVLSAVGTRYRGEKVYVREEKYDEAAVLRDFDYRNHRTVCERHGISRRTLYRILKRQAPPVAIPGAGYRSR